MGHPRGIKQRRGLERILITEISAEQEFAFLRETMPIDRVARKVISAAPEFADLLFSEQVGSNFVKPSFEKLPNVPVAFVEISQQLGQQGMDLTLSESLDFRADRNGALVAHGMERTQQNARAVRIQGDVGPL